MVVGKNEGSLYLIFLFTEAQDYSLPNFYEFDHRFYLGFDSYDQTLRLPENSFTSYEGGRLMIGAYNSGTNNINLQFSVSLLGSSLLNSICF